MIAFGEIFVFTIDVGRTSFSILFVFFNSVLFSVVSANFLLLITLVSEILPLLYAYIPNSYS